jgi:hypothetical protein
MSWRFKVSRTDGFLVLLIILIAVTLCLVGLDWGLPNNQYGDEWAILNNTLMLPYRHGDPRLYTYGVPYMYLYGLVIGVIYGVQWLLGMTSSPDSFAIAFLRDPTLLVVTGRAISSIFAVGGAILTYALSRHFLKPVGSLMVTLAMMTSSTWVAYAHFAKTDQMLAFLFVLTILLLIRSTDSRPRLILSIALAGASVACKLPAVSLAAPILVALLFDLGGVRKAVRHPLFWLSPLIMVAGFALINPWAIFHFGDMVDGLLATKTAYGLSAVKQSSFDNVMFYLRVLSLNCGYAGVALILASPILIALRPARQNAILLASGWALIPLALLLSERSGHWLLPVIPLLLLAGFVLLRELLDRWLNQWQTWVTIVVGLTILVPGAVVSIQQLQKFQIPFTMDLAKTWVEEHIPPGTGIAMDTGRYLPTYAPALRQAPERLGEMIREDKLRQLDMASGGNVDHYYQMLMKANQGLPSYRIFPILHGIPWKTATVYERNTLKPLNAYRALGVRYIITSSAYSDKYAPLADRLDECHDFVADYVAFYRDVLPRLPVATRFKPVPGVVQGPIITIYRLEK